MKKVYMGVCNLILNGKNKDSKCKIEVNTTKIVKRYKINNKDYIYVKIAVQDDELEYFRCNYKDFSIQTVIPTRELPNCRKEVITTRDYRNMNVIYEDMKFQCKEVSEPVIIFSNDKNASLKEIKFILDDTKENEELKDITKFFKNLLFKNIKFKVEDDKKSKEDKK
ncbi:hypothetical protein ACV3UV_11605 [Clostridium perfringens]